MKRLRLTILLLLLPLQGLHAQEIDFGAYGSQHYSIFLTVGAGWNSALDFGQVVRDSGVHEINRGNAAAIRIDGVEYLDVFVEITAINQGQLLLNGVENTVGINDPACSIDLTLFAAYSNTGEPHDPESGSIDIPIFSNTGQARFPIRSRRDAPAGPPRTPPPPPTGAFDQSQVEESAVLYFWGSINVGNVDAGNYYGEIQVVVSYEFPE